MKGSSLETLFVGKVNFLGRGTAGNGLKEVEQTGADKGQTSLLNSLSFSNCFSYSNS